jgi:hypothetical protein
MGTGVLGSRIDLFDAGIAGVFELLEVVAILLDEGDGAFEVVEFGGVFDPLEVDCL